MIQERGRERECEKNKNCSEGNTIKVCTYFTLALNMRKNKRRGLRLTRFKAFSLNRFILTLCFSCSKESNK